MLKIPQNYLHLIRFDKPIGTFLLLWPTLWAISIATSGHFPFPLITTLVFIIEVFLARAIGCVFNDLLDVEFDCQVKRTKNRPLACGKISKTAALIFALSLSSIAFGIALLFFKRSTIYLTIPALILMCSYPYMKRVLAIPQAYLGLAFSFGIPMAFIEIQGTLPLSSYILFAANFFWILGYDTIYALADYADDIKIGVKSAAVTVGRYTILFISGCYILFVILLLVLGLQLGHNYIGTISLVLIICLLASQVCQLVNCHDDMEYIEIFKANNWVGLIVLAYCLH